MNWVRTLVQRVQEYDRLVNIREIARRYFAMNAFDGALTVIGVLMGNLTARVEDPRVVVSTGLATSVAMGVSGLWGAYLTEAAERKRELTELNRFTQTDLEDTRIGRASRVAVFIVAVVDGLSPFLAALISLTPFFFSELFASIWWVYYASLGMALLILFGLGIFLGHISQDKLILGGIKTLAAGLISIAISYLIGA